MQVVVAGSADGLSYGFRASIGAGNICDQPQHGGPLCEKSAAGTVPAHVQCSRKPREVAPMTGACGGRGGHSAARVAVEDILADKKTLPRARARLVPGSDGGGSDGGGTGR